jgi:hypothetical protein
MTHPIIKTDNYLLVVDESEIKAGDWCLDLGTNKMFKAGLSVGDEYKELFKKIIFQLPLNNALTLEGVPLLPPLEDEDDVDSIRIKDLQDFYGTDIQLTPTGEEYLSGFKTGYNKAKEKYKYTEEDLAKLFYVGVQLGINQELAVSSNKSLQDEDAVLKKCIKSLQQPKYPVAFECEMVTPYTDGYADDRVRRFYGVPEAKTITNSQGLTQVVGKYIY